jgi:hypothetical protein
MEHLIDVVIAMTLLESIALGIYHRRTGRGIAPQDFVPTLAAGLALMLAVRAGVTGAGWGFVAAGLTVAGLAHVADVRRRWRSR